MGKPDPDMIPRLADSHVIRMPCFPILFALCKVVNNQDILARQQQLLESYSNKKGYLTNKVLLKTSAHLHLHDGYFS